MSTIVVLEIKLIEMGSVMTEYSIKSKDREFHFQGELIAHQEEAVEFANGESCQMSAKTYSLESGGYVSSLEFLRSDRPDEPIVLFEEIDVKEDVEKFFYVFEPSEVFGEKPRSQEECENVKVNSQKLGHVYEKMIFAFLDQCQAETDARGTKDRPKAEKKQGSIWKKLGIG